ncbi:putative transposase-associated domain-containing protein [Tanacetum coccineum]|uniref:Transposase-associated domain-containing protein n=1 Tax=Tanacetum coccineum TaxID=301880 RepID=A0ABQ4Z686_9ASTR
MGTNRTNKSYVDGVAAFIDYAHKVEEVQFHLFRNRIDLSYTIWTRHGEKDEPSISSPEPVNATTEFVDDTDFASDIPIDGPATVEMVNATKDNFDEDDLVKFQELLLDAEKPLYEGYPDFTKLYAIVKLLNLKGKYEASDEFFTELLGLIKKILLAGNEMVEKTYQAKKVMKLMGSGYKKIHVCINNFLLYWKDDKDLTACQTCGISRWKVDNKTHKVHENIPAKAWRTIDEKFPKIVEDPRNLRLGISADGVDVNTGNRHHSVWPVLTVIYNLPPWLCMKRKFIMLSVLISGYPRNDIDVFLEPLVDDLHTLFETGVDTYDVSTKDNFNLRAVVLWTINDYPALGTLCGCPYSGFKGCVVCGKDTNCVRLSASSKQSYVGHRRYLPYNHPFRKQKKAFNGQQEFLPAPIPMTTVWKQIYNEFIEKNVAREFSQNLYISGRKDERGLNAQIGIWLSRDKMQAELVVTLCLLEKFFPSSFFDIMIHLTVHLTREANNHKSMETIGIPPDKHETYENKEGKPLSAGKSSEVSVELFQKAHLYVIQNTDEIVPYIERHKQVLKIENLGKRIAFLENEHSKSFAKWWSESLAIESVSETVRWIYLEHAPPSDDKRWAAKKASAPVFYGPSTQGLLDAYGCDTIEEYLEWNYFPSTDNESTNMETTDKGNTYKDCIDDSNSAMSKGKYVPVCKKHNPNMYSPVPVIGCVLGLASVTTWDEIEKKMGVRKSKNLC